ncbi:TAXI family TRAP transporter solute-binding subunit [Halalkalibacter okhensis]|uniref:TAXI family TRAP transporter solute-binding subunit n=1 Tax=Halalkalibacter okhensis TaxID=333138 RepID=A0A0B0IPJ9_9BACI|nr:TAXI family TRAP transporter solute-binding subunit [Halalkalibacter okhensis]KHF41606.1 hypothetical protein LQ50_02565 [Halalkalibacter okhensis]
MLFEKKNMILVLLTALSLLFLGACGGENSSSAPEPSESEPPTEETANDGESNEDGSTSEEHEPFDLDIYTFQNGTTTYVLGVGLAEMINQNSDWLQANTLESPGATQNATMLINEPDKRGNTVAWIDQWGPKNAWPPFEEVYEDFRGLSVTGLVNNVLITTNPDIKTIHDLAGKTVNLGVPPDPFGVDLVKLMFEKAGVENVRFENMPFNQSHEALMQGRIDAAISGGFSSSADGSTWGGIPALNELMTRTDVYFVSYDESALTEAMEEMDSAGFSFEIPAGGMSEQQTEPLNVFANTLMWVADKELPDHVAHEIVRIMAENHTRFGDFHPAGNMVTPENMPKMILPEEEIHPGSLKYYQDNDLSIEGSAFE